MVLTKVVLRLVSALDSKSYNDADSNLTLKQINCVQCRIQVRFANMVHVFTLTSDCVPTGHPAVCSKYFVRFSLHTVD